MGTHIFWQYISWYFAGNFKTMYDIYDPYFIHKKRLVFGHHVSLTHFYNVQMKTNICCITEEYRRLDITAYAYYDSCRCWLCFSNFKVYSNYVYWIWMMLLSTDTSKIIYNICNLRGNSRRHVSVKWTQRTRDAKITSLLRQNNVALMQ